MVLVLVYFLYVTGVWCWYGEVGCVAERNGMIWYDIVWHGIVHYAFIRV